MELAPESIAARRPARASPPTQYGGAGPRLASRQSHKVCPITSATIKTTKRAISPASVESQNTAQFNGHEGEVPVERYLLIIVFLGFGRSGSEPQCVRNFSHLGTEFVLVRRR